MPSAVRTIPLPSGEAIPVLGQGTWGMAENPSKRKTEVAALRLGIDLGMTLIDTAEMYADGGAEELVGAAISGRRDDVFLVTKVLPQHASRTGTIAACDQSLARLRTDRVDLYLLHWRGRIPIEDTLDAFATLVDKGKIRYWGVSNFDLADMTDLVSRPGGAEVATDQVLYNLARRGIEFDLLPWCRLHRIPVMAYSPVEQGRLLQRPVVRDVARRHGATAAEVALAWVLQQEWVTAIPKAASPPHVRQNRAALDLRLTPEDLADLERAFPAPTRAGPLEML